jgi:FdhE protein
MTRSATALEGLKRRRGEWAPWLAVVEESVRETAAPAWDAAVPALSDMRHPAAPLLAGAALSIDARAVRGFLGRLIRIASRSGTAKMATLRAALGSEPDALTLFTASLSQDSAYVTGLAARLGVDADAFQAVAALLPVPFLQACTRRWAPFIPMDWVQGYCPVCASWPAFAEARGIERSRHFRCGRCGGEWLARLLHCPYCAMSDHAELVALVPEKSDSHAVIDACKGCGGYVKTFTTLQGCTPGAVMLEDLASVALDVAALEQGYTRPPGAGYPLDVTAADRGAARRLFA